MGAVTKCLMNNQNYFFLLTLWSNQASRVWLIQLSRASQGKAFTLRTLLALYVMRHNVRVSFVNAFSDFEGILLIIDLVRESPPCVKWSPALHDTNYILTTYFIVYLFLLISFLQNILPPLQIQAVFHMHTDAGIPHWLHKWGQSFIYKPEV